MIMKRTIAVLCLINRFLMTVFFVFFVINALMVDYVPCMVEPFR